MANEKRVRQAFLGGLVDTADLAAAATTFNSAGLAALATTIDTTNHLPIILDPDGIMGAPEIAYLTAVTAGATSGTILKGQEGTTDRAHLKGTPWVHGPTKRDFALGRSIVKQRTSGNVGFPSGAWTAVDTALDISLAAVAGDVVEFGISCVWNDAGGGSPTIPNWTSFDVASMNGSTIIEYFSNGGTTPGTGWAAWVTSGYTALQGVGGNALHVVTAADIISGSVTLRVYGGNGGTSTRTVRATTGDPFICWAKNLGPQEA